MLILLFFIGLFTGGLSGLFGVGGGFVLVPLLNLAGIPIKTAIALSLVYIIGTAISGIIRHLKQGTADVALALVLSSSSIITAQFGAMITAGMPSTTLKLLFGLLTLSVAIFYAVRQPPKSAEPRQGENFPVDEKGGKGRESPFAKLTLIRCKLLAGHSYQYRFNVLVGLLLGSGIGFLSGMFGVGGGFIMVPMMVVLLGVPLRIAVGTSLLSVLAPSASGAFALWLAGKLELDLLPALLVGGLLGAQIGARFVLIFRGGTLKIAFNTLLVSVSGYMLAIGLGLL